MGKTVYVILVGMMLAAATGVAHGEEVDPWRERRVGPFWIDGMLGVNVHSHDMRDPKFSNLQRNVNKLPTPLFGMRVVFCRQYEVGDDTFDIRGEWYAHTNFILSAALLDGPYRFSGGALATARYGNDNQFAIWTSGIALDWVLVSGFFQSHSSERVLWNVRLGAGIGHWIGKRDSLELTFLSAYLIRYDKWAIGAELVLSIGTERLRLLYMTQFDAGKALGPHPYVLVAYEFVAMP